MKKTGYAIVISCNVSREKENIIEIWFANAYGLFIREEPRYVQLPLLKIDRLPRCRKKIGRTFRFSQKAT